MNKWYVFLILGLAGIALFWKPIIKNSSFSSCVETCINVTSIADDLQYYCTAANKNYYEQLLNLIASIHRHNFDNLGHIAVFDLGLSSSQINYLSHIQKVGIYKLELVNPYILTKYKANQANKMVVGWYSWKPVAIKQAFEIFPEESVFLWIDAGTTVLKDISILFTYIKHKGYFFFIITGLLMKKS